MFKLEVDQSESRMRPPFCDSAHPRQDNLILITVDSPNNGHFGTWASVLYSGSVLYCGVLVKHLPFGLNNAFDTLDSTIAHF